MISYVRMPAFSEAFPPHLAKPENDHDMHTKQKNLNRYPFHIQADKMIPTPFNRLASPGSGKLLPD